MTRYDTYKDSGVQWLGVIPGHWKSPRLKNLMTLINGRAYLQPELQDEGQYRILRVGNFFTNDKWYYSDMELEASKYCSKGDLLFAWSASFGPYIWKEEKVIYHYHIWKVELSPKYDKMYAYYMFLALSEAKKRDVHGSTMVHLTLQDMNQTHIPFPPLSEQHAIVSYLDDKCGKIDKLLEGKQKQIDLLTETKQRIIADAVTRGLNPTVKMKPTNISWLPEIPEHWEERRMATQFIGDVLTNKDFEYKHAFKFNYGQLVPKNEIGDPKEYREAYCKYSILKRGDILINGLNLNYDFVSQRVACAPSDGIITSAYVVCRPRESVNYDYYTYLFKAMDGMKLFHGMGTGIRLTLSFKELKKQLIPIPPLSEQRSIVSYIESRTSKIDLLADKLQQEIEAIKEYKQRLISDVVTGRVKVC